MHRSLLIGIGAGIFCAVLFASASAGMSALGVVFFLFSTLPIFIAGLSGGWRAGALATVTASIMTSVALGSPVVGLTFAATQLIPATILCYFALLYREGTVSTPPHAAGAIPSQAPSRAPSQATASEAAATGPYANRHWYPLGWTLLWATGMAIAVAIALLFIAAPDMAEVETLLRSRLDAMLDAQLPKGAQDAKTVSAADRENLVKVMVDLLPAAITMSILLTLLLNFWLGGRIARALGTLDRSWPDLAAITFPAGTPVALVLSLLGAWMLGDKAGFAASAAAGGLFFAYMLLGLAIIHHVTRGYDWRVFALAGVYFLAIVINSAFWVLIVLIGLAEPISPLRRKLGDDP